MGGENRSGAPAKAYIEAITDIWKLVPHYLSGAGLVAMPLSELFNRSREFYIPYDKFPMHLRVFNGDICSGSEAVTQFMLSVPHFWMGVPYLQIARIGGC